MSRDHKPGLRAQTAERELDPLEDVSPEERRGALRQPSFMAGEILLEDGRKVACIVRNVSDSGCLMKLDKADALPDYVVIRLDADDTPRPAEIVWRSTSLAGAMFIPRNS